MSAESTSVKLNSLMKRVQSYFFFLICKVVGKQHWVDFHSQPKWNADDKSYYTAAISRGGPLDGGQFLSGVKAHGTLWLLI